MPLVDIDGERFRKLWLNQNWYVPVNKDGYCAGTYFEGALGVVVQLIHRSGTGTQALKIPRLTADTPKENAYINQLVIEEEKRVSSIFTDDRHDRRNLLTSQYNLNNVLLKPISTEFAHDEAKSLNHHIIAVQFNHGMPPRFCAVDIHPDESGRHGAFPPEIEDCPLQEDLILSRVAEASRLGDEEWGRTVVVIREGNNLANVFEIDEAFRVNLCSGVWYVGIPCVAYAWGTGSLQEAVSMEAYRNWSLKERLILVNNIVSGVQSLHCRTMLHTDLRPSNVMFVGDMEDPNSYYLIDYAAYNLSPAERELKAEAEERTAGSLLGPTMGRERSSPFHAPERRLALEKEAGDVAVLVRDESERFRVLVGWSRELIHNGKVSKELKERLLGFSFEEDEADGLKMIEQSHANEYDLLLPGDRLQLGDYIFDVEAVASLEDKQIMLCSKKHWKVYHGKIVVAGKEGFPKSWISIPKVIELRQWSPAADIFGVGALFLYVLFKNGLVKESESVISSDLAYFRMLNQLENIYFFKHIWPTLTGICAQLSCLLEAPRTHDLNLLEEIYKPCFEDLSSPDFPGASASKTLDSLAQSLTRYILDVVPETGYILEGMHFNYYYFLLSLHFILLCLHKRTTLYSGSNPIVRQAALNTVPSATGYGMGRELLMPFCKSRLDSLQPGMAGSKLSSDLARQYLIHFSRIVDSEVLTGYTMQMDVSPGQFHSPSEEIHARFIELQSKYNALLTGSEAEKEKCSELSDTIGILKASNAELSGKCDELTVANNELGLKLAGLQRAHEKLQDSYKDATAEKDRLVAACGSLREQVFESGDVEDCKEALNKLRIAYNSTCDAIKHVADMLDKIKERPLIGGYTRDEIQTVQEALYSILCANKVA